MTRRQRPVRERGSRTAFGYAAPLLLGLILWIGLTAAFAVSCKRFSFQQRGAAAYLAELATILGIYIAAILFSKELDGARWQGSQRIAVAFGLLSAMVETTGILLESVAPELFRHAAVSVSIMLSTFVIWGVAAIWTPRSSTPWKSGLLAAVGSAGICMLITVAIGFPIELFLKPPDPAVVATWHEYQRSGWTDPRLFAVANTFDSGFTHLLFAPFVACIFGCFGLLLKQRGARNLTRTREPAG